VKKSVGPVFVFSADTFFLSRIWLLARCGTSLLKEMRISSFKKSLLQDGWVQRKGKRWIFQVRALKI
jgi:hypothetical protein